jgi:alkylation response protein AidB-like acyl-CoA dehydrogenase
VSVFLDFTPEQQRIMALAKELAQEFAQRAEQHDREGSFPFENIARLKETGYTTLTTPKEYGSWGATPLTFILAQEQLVQGYGIQLRIGLCPHAQSTEGRTTRQSPAVDPLRSRRDV